MLYMLKIYVINRVMMCINDIATTWYNIALINIDGFNNLCLNQSFKLFRSTCNAIESRSTDIYLNNYDDRHPPYNKLYRQSLQK